MADELPIGFEDLAPFIGWAQPSEQARNEHRWSATMADSQAFYDVMLERARGALDYLNARPLTALDAAERRLLDLCLGFVECAVTVEMYGEPRPKYVFPIARFTPVHDRWPFAEEVRA